MWAIADVAIPCVAGNEYSMSSVLEDGTDVAVEAGSSRTLAIYAVTRHHEVFRRLGDPRAKRKPSPDWQPSVDIEVQ